MAASLAAPLYGATVWAQGGETDIQIGPRPYYLVDKLSDGELKTKLQSCTNGPFRKSNFSIGHRGAPLQFPEHTKESYTAAARMGAGILECDVTFTKDAELVCRHAQCDLHTTTNILATPLAAKCEQPFAAAEFDADGNLVKPASAKCCASALTLAEFKSLEGKMDASDPTAKTVETYMGGTAGFRTDLYATGATLMTHKESIELFKSLGVGMTPELKGVDADTGFGESGLTQESYAAKMIQDYIDSGVAPESVWAQSFNFDDVLYWIKAFPDFGKQAVFLDDRDPKEMVANPPSVEDFAKLKGQGVNIIAPPMPTLLTVADGKIVPSDFAKNAKEAGLDIISWSLERSGRIGADIKDKGGNYYFDTTLDALENDGAIMTTIDVLSRGVGIIGLFSDWPATTTYYASCYGLD
ncbi:MAG: glycerophosphodiester phosphodiesterase [Hyphomicrobiales bacterium]|nr:glycerophosphodiester phosphodiesterase [Hyphomicrobiales bacterium]